MEPIKDVREISRIAYGFMASKVLFAALNAGLFDRLAEGPKPLAELQRATGIAENRLVTLLTACTSLGLIGRDGGSYVNAPASAGYLVSSSPQYFGDYFRFQIDRTPSQIRDSMTRAGFGPAEVLDVIPGLTRGVVAAKPV